MHMTYIFLFVTRSRAVQATNTEEDLKERKIRIPFMATEAEKRKFEKLAVSRYTTLSELIRQLLHREADSQGQGA